MEWQNKDKDKVLKPTRINLAAKGHKCNTSEIKAEAELWLHHSGRIAALIGDFSKHVDRSEKVQTFVSLKCKIKKLRLIPQLFNLNELTLPRNQKLRNM